MNPLTYLDLRLCKTAASFRYVRLAMSSIFSNFGGFIDWMSSFFTVFSCDKRWQSIMRCSRVKLRDADSVAFVITLEYGSWDEMNRNNLIALTAGVVNYRPQRSWGKVIFSEACVENSVHRGVSRQTNWADPPVQTPPGADTPRADTPLGTHPLGTPAPKDADPLEQILLGADTPQADTPREQCMLGDMGNKRAVHILLECILVTTWIRIHVESWSRSNGSPFVDNWLRKYGH